MCLGPEPGHCLFAVCLFVMCHLFVWLFACLLACVLVCLLASLFVVWLVGWLVGGLVGFVLFGFVLLCFFFLFASLVDWLVGCSLGLAVSI